MYHKDLGGVQGIELLSFTYTKIDIVINRMKLVRETYNKVNNSLKIHNEIRQNKNSKAYFTICSRNFLAHALTLCKSLMSVYENVNFFVTLCDVVDSKTLEERWPFELITLDNLMIKDIDEMCKNYNITEFNTSIKPYVFIYLFNNLGFDAVIYLDPDIFIVTQMKELDNYLDMQVSAVLTPHITNPSIGRELDVDEQAMLRYGIYNLGFLAMTRNHQVLRFLAWWARVLINKCIIDLNNGIFVDQKWVDLLPAFVNDTVVIRHLGYNIAYWNIPQRSVSLINDMYLVNNKDEIRFVHFSGSNLDDETVFSRHYSRIGIHNIGDLKYLLELYRRNVFKNGHDYFRKIPYGYNWGGRNNANVHTPETLDQSKLSGVNIEFDELIQRHQDILYIDWAIPMPDRDAGSLTA